MDYIGFIKQFAGNYAPTNYAFCNGQRIEVRTNPALFSILHQFYGGDGRTFFNLPDLRPVDENNQKRDWFPNEPKWIICVNGHYPIRD